jgi:single-stranded-DNA-specific exonuclease
MKAASAAHIDRNRIAEHAALFGLNSVIISILHSRGYDTPPAIEEFLNPRMADMHSPFMLSGMHQAIARVRKAIENGERIGIFADSDLDGITSLAVVHSLLKRMKIDPFLRYLKNDENYGMTREIIDEFARNGVNLIITVDSGTRDVSEIAYARSLGMDVIVTDHHEQDAEVPDAIIVNPKISGDPYPFKGLAGVGVSFKLCHALLLSYLPSYNKTFLIVAVERAGYSISWIRNCVIERIAEAASPEAVEQAISAMEDEATVLVHGDNQSRFKTPQGKTKIYPYVGFISDILRKKFNDIEEVCSYFNLKRHLYVREIDILNKLFLDTQMAGSDKIRQFIDSVIGLVSIGSIADVTPLTGENRLLVKYGIDALNGKAHENLSMLARVTPITSRTIGWGIAPVLNTPGRLGKTDLAVSFFIETDRRALSRIAAEIKTLNENRRSFITEFCARIMDDINAGTLKSDGRLIFIKTAEITDGYAGLIANRISDATGKPVIVAVLPGKEGIIKGSGRSRGGVKFFSCAGKFSDRFERIGGHENAFGFTVKAHRIDEIVESIEQSLGEFEAPEDEILIDQELEMDRINIQFIDELRMLEPFGNGNGEPVFITRNVRFASFNQFGANHGKYMVSENNALAAIGWGMGPLMKDLFHSGRPLDVVYRLEINSFNGSVTPRMILMDIKQSQDSKTGR